MEIYGKRSSTSPTAELSGVCSHLARSQQIGIEEREFENYYLYGQLLTSKKYRFVFIWVLVCLFFVCFACLFACLFTYRMFRGIIKKQLGVNKDKIIDLIARKLYRSQAEAS